MAEDYSVRAILSAYDKGFSSAMQAAAKQTSALDASMGTAIKTGGLMRVGMMAADKAVGAITSHMGAAIDRFDALKSFPKVMESLGFSFDEAKEASDRMVEGIQDLPTSLDEITKNTQQIALITGDLDGATDAAIALNDAFLASGASGYDAARGFTQFTQMLATGKVDAQSWNSVAQTMPVALNKVAESFGYTGKSAKQDLYAALKSGEITFDELTDRFVKLDGESKNFVGFAKMARTQSDGIRTAFTNIGLAVTSGIADSLKAIETLMEDNGFGGFVDNAKKIKNVIKDVFSSVNDTISKVDLKGAVEAAKPYWNAFVTVLKAVGGGLKAVGGFLAEHAGIVTKVGIPLIGLIASWRMLAGALEITKGPLSLITGHFKTLAQGVLAKLAPQLFTTATAETSAGTAAGAAAGNMLRMGAAVALMGVGILMVGAGFGLMAQAAISLANSGNAATSVFFGMTAALGLLMALVTVLGPALAAGAVGMAIFGAAVILMGTGVLIAAAGLSIMASAMPILAASAGVAAVGIAKLAAALVAMVPAAAGALAASGSLAALAAAAKLAGMGAKSGSKGIEKLSAASKTASTAVKALLATLKATGSAAKTAGKAVGQGFSTGIKSQKGAITAAGKNVAQGLINGLKSKRQAAYNEGVQAGKAYNKGLKKTEQVKSPSRVTAKIGGHIGQGLVNGLKDKNKLVEDMGVMAARLYNASLSPMGQVAYAGGLSDDYSYGRTIEVPLYINGREFAKATSSDIQNELSTRQTLKNRLSGRT